MQGKTVLPDQKRLSDELVKDPAGFAKDRTPEVLRQDLLTIAGKVSPSSIEKMISCIASRKRNQDKYIKVVVEVLSPYKLVKNYIFPSILIREHSKRRLHVVDLFLENMLQANTPQEIFGMLTSGQIIQTRCRLDLTVRFLDICETMPQSLTLQECKQSLEFYETILNHNAQIDMTMEHARYIMNAVTKGITGPLSFPKIRKMLHEQAGASPKEYAKHLWRLYNEHPASAVLEWLVPTGDALMACVDQMPELSSVPFVSKQVLLLHATTPILRSSSKKI